MTQTYAVIVYLLITLYFIIAIVLDHFFICLQRSYSSKMTCDLQFSFSCFRAASKQPKHLKNKTKYRDNKVHCSCVYCTEAIPQVTILEKRVFL